MATELCLESLNMSPRISFSYDLCKSEIVPIEKLPIRSNSSPPNSRKEFDFHVHDSFCKEYSWADELFSNGRILPTEIQKKKKITRRVEQFEQSMSSSPPPLPLPRPGAFLDSTRGTHWKKISKDIKIISCQTKEKESSKSFWQIKRSNSVNCVRGYGRALCPFMPLLSRSKSTSSAPIVQQVPLSKDSYNHEQKIKPLQRSSSTCHHYHKPPLKKNTRGSYYGNGVRVDPVLNVPSVNLICFDSVFSIVKMSKN
ncbi:hypothetical protein CFOL_v3_28976 [Cephalotus follicularis]|uniref:Uncharacterized protein n=1 Tax=Cephalotus follicularis TaxID=3775 RepID=A0A1Q3CZ82_CEPFO|nr:hypothetical protein CFOL_v3_28976 [Cephalotus follicularis]